MLDGRVLGASQVEYKPFGKPSLKREVASSKALQHKCHLCSIPGAPPARQRSLPGRATCPALKPRQAAEPPLSRVPCYTRLIASTCRSTCRMNMLGGLEGREALPAVSGGPVLQLLPPGHADGPSSACPGEVVVGQLKKVVQHGADGVVLVAVPLVVPQPQLLGWHVAAAADSDVAGRGRDGLVRWLLLRYVDRRGGRAVDLEVRVARQGSELCGGLAPVAQLARAAALSECARPSLDSTGRRGATARRPSWRSLPCISGTCTPRSRRCWWAWLPGSAAACLPAPGSCGSGCSARCAGEAARCAGRCPCRGALLEDVVVLLPVCCHTKTKTSTRAALRSSKASMSSKFTGRSVGRPEKSTPASARAGCQPGGRGPQRPASSG